jgi:malate/lactate dehydrogenase
MSKVSVIGAGNVGASCAEYIAMKDFAAEVVLLDRQGIGPHANRYYQRI